MGGTRPDAAVDLAIFRRSVEALVSELGSGDIEVQRRRARGLLAEIAAVPEIAATLELTPGGLPGAVTSMSREVVEYHPNSRTAAHDLPALLRILLLSQIDAMWWGHVSAYPTTDMVDSTADLVDVRTAQRGRPPVRCRIQPKSRMHRWVRAVERRVAPDRTPRTAGVLSPRTRPEVMTLLDRVAADFHRNAPGRTPPLWVTSMTRSVEHQERLRALGYSAVLPSAHCTGYAVDLEMRWLERFGGAQALAQVLWTHQEEGWVNVINEGQAWHVCISPRAVTRLRTDDETRNED